MHFDSKRIARNTALLYFRMIFMTGISLYTSRVVLSALGVADFGIYNVVGGIVVLLSFLNVSMASATQRFLNIELGKHDKVGLKNVFETSIVIHLLIAICVLLLIEFLGVWFLNNYMIINADRMIAANVVLQFSVLSLLITIVSVPYNAAIIAHEKMSAFAYFSVVEALLKLLIVYLLLIIPYDRLEVYSVLMMVVALIVRLLYCYYCRIHFEECKSTHLAFNPALIKEMLGFSSWTIVGSLGSMSHTQGIGIIMNMFFGVTVNAAQGIANQIIHIVNQFVSNFMTALNPQIVKTYAANEIDSMHLLLKNGSRLGVFLVALFAVPLVIETPFVLNLWLEEVPEYTSIFVRIILITSLCNAYASPLSVAKGATGDIKTYQVILTSLGLLHLPLAWFFFELGFGPEYAMYIYFILVNIMQLFRIIIVCRSINMPLKPFFVDVLMRSFLAISFAFILSYMAHICLSNTMILSVFSLFLSFLLVMASFFFLGISRRERYIIRLMVIEKIKTIK